MAVEASRAFEFSVGRMLAHGELAAVVGQHVYQAQAPQRVFDLTDIYILGTYLAGDDLNGNGGARLATGATILWRARKRGHATAELARVDRLMDEALTARADAFEGFVFSVIRETPFDGLPYDAALNPYSEAGGLYGYTICPAGGE